MTPGPTAASALAAGRLVAVDWGTSALRGVLLDGQGQVLDQVASAQGILNVPANGFQAAFDRHFGHWMTPSAGAAPLCLIAGMAGSQQGWVEAPYCACPAGFDELAARLQWVQPGRIAIVPGLCCEHEGVPDVMRGEEVQVFGALHLLGLQDAQLVLPGTHSKWVTVQGRRITQLRTCMTGEVFALLRQQSILARTLPPLGDGAPADPLDPAAFDEGVAQALRARSLLTTAFSTRTLSLFGRKSAPALASYLSGLVIGEELRAQAPELTAGRELILMGSEALTQRYAQALAQLQVPVRRVGAEATWQGLWAIFQTLNRDGPGHPP